MPERASITELSTPPGLPQKKRRPRSLRERLWGMFFAGVDRVLKEVEARRYTPLRRRALARAEAWILERLDGSDGLGAIFPPIINTIFAFRALGHPVEHEVIQSQLRALESLEIEEDETLRLQPCFSAVWDTALAVHILRQSSRAINSRLRWGFRSKNNSPVS